MQIQGRDIGPALSLLLLQPAKLLKAALFSIITSLILHLIGSFGCAADSDSRETSWAASQRWLQAFQKSHIICQIDTVESAAFVDIAGCKERICRYVRSAVACVRRNRPTLKEIHSIHYIDSVS
jgi:hypothetical protein